MPVDTVRSWVIVGACFYMNLIIYGVIRMSGIFFVESMTRYNVGRSSASFPYTFVNFIKYLFGPLLGYLAHKFGIHKIVIIGSLLSTLGLGACFFVENIGFISLFYGVILGIGSSSCLLLPLLINQHFYKYRAIASGLRTSGISFGSFVLPPLTEILLERYGLSGTFLVLSGLVFNCLPATLLLRTLKFNSTSQLQPFSLWWTNTEKQPLLQEEKTKKFYSEKSSKQTETSNALTEEKQLNCELNRQCLKEVRISNESAITKISHINKRSLEKTQNNFNENDIYKKESLYSIDEKANTGKANSKSVYLPAKNSSISQKVTSFRVVLDPVFICLAFERSFYTFILSCFLTVIVDFASDIGISDQEQGYTVMVFSIGELIGPLGLGWLVDKSYFSKTTFTAIACYLQSLITVSIVFSKGSAMLLSLLGAMGCVHSVETFVAPLLVADYIPEGKQTVAMTSISFLAAPLCLIVSPLIGFLRDEIGSYEYMFYGLGVISAICGSLIIIIPCIINRRNKV